MGSRYLLAPLARWLKVDFNAVVKDPGALQGVSAKRDMPMKRESLNPLYRKGKRVFVV